jgi:hypothetical protein
MKIARATKGESDRSCAHRGWALGRRTSAVAAVVCATLLGGGVDARASYGGVHRAAACGPARADIRTLSDAKARRLGGRPVRTTVGVLSGEPRPGGAKRGRVRGAETTTFRIEASLVGMRLVAGREAVLVVSDVNDAAKTIEVRFPFAGCAGRRSAQRAAIRRARAALTAACGKPTRRFTRLSGYALITGVGYLGTSAAAGKGVGLAPALRFRHFGCGRVLSAQPGPGPPAVDAQGGAAPAVPTPPPPPPPGPGCTRELTGGSIEAEANARPNQVICLHTGRYTEPGDSLIVLMQAGVRIQPAPGSTPVVCGHILARGTGTSVGEGIVEDPSCATWFNERSPFNITADAYGAPVPIPESWLSDFDGTGQGRLRLQRNWEHGKAIFRAAPSDPVTAVFRIADPSQCFDDPIGCPHWQPVDPDHHVADDTTPAPDSIPIPAGVRCAGLPAIDNQHDRALVVISADGKTAWEFWHCTHAATEAEPYYTAAVAVKWRIDPDDPTPAARGYQDQNLAVTGSQSARASGMPLLTTTITPREALFGIHRAIGLTVSAIGTGYVNPPASHTDMCDGCSHLHYGMLFVLNPAFQLPADATPAELNIVTALKKYGAYITDRGPVFELDGSPNEPTDPSRSDQLWADAQDGDLARLNIRPSDFLYVQAPGAPPPLP